MRRDVIRDGTPIKARLPGSKFPAPEPDEIVMMRREKAEVGIEIKRGRRIIRPDVWKIVPGMGTGEINRLPGAVGEVARVPRMQPQRPGSGRLLEHPICGQQKTSEENQSNDGRHDAGKDH